ncbi:MAG TPA: hypothetical protein VLK79_16610 [Gaiellales bacterium]|nr:hypothetical protein [Gaiellales bacterium]
MPLSEPDRQAAQRGGLGCPECCRGVLWWLPIERVLACDTCGVEVEPGEIASEG